MKSGIYAILNIVNDKFYVGSAKSFKNRWATHLYCLKANKHYSRYLQHAWNKYWGECSFIFVVLEYTDNLIEREQYWIDTLKPQYNLCPVAGNNLGVKYSEESKKKMSSWQVGRKMSVEARLKMSIAKKGKPRLKRIKFSEEAKRKISERMKGKKQSTKQVKARLEGKFLNRQNNFICGQMGAS